MSPYEVVVFFGAPPSCPETPVAEPDILAGIRTVSIPSSLDSSQRSSLRPSTSENLGKRLARPSETV